MTELGLKVPTRNILTGAVVNWTEDDNYSETLDGLTLAWKDLTVFRRRKLQKSIWRSPTYEEVKVLHGVNGIATQGNLYAIMGASGAGKTTLLAAISCRDKSDITGSLTLNGNFISPSTIAKISGFVPQQDLAVEDLNVGEHMEFMARLMMDRRCNGISRSRRIHLLLTELNVVNCMRTKLAALSGGERKRVSLAVQLLNDPPLLFCDEPTTGLDSWQANAVTSRLRRLAASGKMVICSIHQPASGVFEMFHQVIFLAGGRVAFQGTIEDALNFFSGLQYKCPVGYNQAEYYVSLLGVEVGQELESHERIRRICDEFRRSKMAEDIEKKLDREIDPNVVSVGSIFDTSLEFDPLERYLTLKKANYFIQFYWLLWRNIAALTRNYSVWLAEFIVYMGIAVMLSIPYMNVTRELDQRDIQNVEGLMYMIITQTIFIYIYSVFVTFPSEMPVLLRETANGLYAPGPYYFSKMIFWIPRAVIPPMIYTTMIFHVVGLQGGFHGWCALTFVNILCANYANAYGSFLSATFESFETAALVAVPVDLIGTMFSGIYININSITTVFAWLKYISPFYYGTEAISIVQWKDIDEIKCVNSTGVPCIRTGAEVLNALGYDEDNFWINVICLTVMYILGHAIALIMIIKRSHRAPVY